MSRLLFTDSGRAFPDRISWREPPMLFLTARKWVPGPGRYRTVINGTLDNDLIDGTLSCV